MSILFIELVLFFAIAATINMKTIRTFIIHSRSLSSHSRSRSRSLSSHSHSRSLISRSGSLSSSSSSSSSSPTPVSPTTTPIPPTITGSTSKTTTTPSPNEASLPILSKGLRVMQQYLPKAVPPTPRDLEVINTRQLNGRTMNGIYGVEKERCRHGFPRAFVLYPVSESVQSGMVRLSCPHLVQAVDEYERDGAIKEFDALLKQEEEGKLMRKSFDKTNIVHKNLRSDVMTDEDYVVMKERLGDAGARDLMGSGFIGVSIGRLQTKCVHAHVADHLLRGENEIGKEALRKLTEDRGVDATGCNDCWQQCSLDFTPTSASWWYVPKGNKQGLQLKRLLRHDHKLKKEARAARLRAAREAGQIGDEGLKT